MSFSDSIIDGTVCLFSLKNPSYPEWICPTESPVMCLDFSEQHPHLLVIGNKNKYYIVHFYYNIITKILSFLMVKVLWMVLLLFIILCCHLEPLNIEAMMLFKNMEVLCGRFVDYK